MKFPVQFLRRRWPVALGAVLLTPPLLWVAVLAVVPTDWARRTIAERLAAASGRTVRLGGLSVGWLGGISLTDLHIGAPDSGSDPWLRAGRASVDVSLGQLVCGQVEPTEVGVERLAVRVLRRADGTLELADFLKRPVGPNSSDDDSCDLEKGGLIVSFKGATVTLVDEPTDTRLDLIDVEGVATYKGRFAGVSDLRGRLNGGTFALAAHVDRTDHVPAFEGQVQIRDVTLDDRMNALDYLAPVLAGAKSLNGKLSLDFRARGRGDSRESLRSTLTGNGRLTLDPVQLDGSRFLDEISYAVDLPTEGRVGSLRADLAIKDGRVGTENLTIDVARVPIVLSGWTEFDGRASYRLRTDELAERLPARAKSFLAEMDLALEDVADVRISGTVDDLEVTFDGVALRNPSKPGVPRIDDRDRLREIGRRLRDRIRR